MEDDLNLPRIFSSIALQAGMTVDLPATAARHVQVLRLQPNDFISLFDGHGGQWKAKIINIGRNHVQARIESHHAIEREAEVNVSLLVGIPANERMDFLVEKATELGVTHIYPLLFTRSVIKLNAERAQKKVAHWQAVAIAACEQCGRNKIPRIHPVMKLSQLMEEHLNQLPQDRRVLSFQANSQPWVKASLEKSVCVLSGPEGGLTPDEEDLLIQTAHFKPYTLGPRVLRADTAPLAALSNLIIGN